MACVDKLPRPKRDRLSGRMKKLIVLVLSGLGLMGAVWSLGGGTGGAGAAPAASWSWGNQLPGTVVANANELSFQARSTLDAVTRISPGVTAGSSHHLITSGVPSREMALIAARGIDGATCLTFVTGGAGSEFSCLGREIGSGAIIRFVRDGGTRMGVVEWVTLVGVARGDVARVTLVTRAGTERELPVNAWRAFGFSTASEASFPAALRAYAADGSVIEELPTFP